MADVVTRLKVESSEYDQKLSRATQQLQHMEKEVRRTGATFAYADKEELAFAQSLGQMETKANSAKGKINEMTQAFVELSVQYNKLTKEEKSSAYGKALASSLDQLKSRIKGAKSELAGIEGQLTGMGDVFKQVGSKMGIPIEMFTKLGPVVAAAGAAIKIGTDAFKKNEEMLDDWNATVAGAQSIYESFLVSLNTGDFSGFLRRMSNVSRAAREAYDALDKLGTFNAFNQINLQRAQTQFTEAVASYREGTGSKSEVRAAADAWKNELETRRKMEQDAYLAKIREIAASRGVDADLLTKALSGNYGDYETLKATQMPTKSVYNSSTRSFNDVIDNDAATEVQKLGQALRQLNDTQLQEIQALGRQAQATANEIAQVDKQVVRVTGAKKQSSTSATKSSAKVSGDSGFKFNNYLEAPAAGSLADLEAQAATVRNSMGGAINNKEYAEMEAHLQSIIDKMNEIKGVKKVAFTPGSLNDLNQQLREAQDALANMSPEADGWAAALELVRQKMAEVAALQEKINGSSSTSDAGKDMKGLADNVDKAISAFGQLGGAMQQIEDPSAKVAGIIMGAIAEVAGSFAASLKGTFTPWDWIAAAISGTATMISTIAAIKSATSGAKGYAQGGVVGGNSYSGDNIVARLNSGEGVLTASGIENAANMAATAGNPLGNLQLETRLSGTELLILLNNTNRSLGGSRNFYTERH